MAAIDKTRQRPAEQFHQDKNDGGEIVRFETSTDPVPLPIFVTRTTLAQLLAAHPAKSDVCKFSPWRHLTAEGVALGL